MEVRFECLVGVEGSGQDGELRVLCARPTVLPRTQNIMDLYLTHPDGTKELGALLLGGTGATALYHFYGVEQEGGYRRLRRKHLLQFFRRAPEGFRCGV